MELFGKHISLCMLILAAGAMAAPLCASAQDEGGKRLAPVEVDGNALPPARVDVRHSCPDYGQTLRTSLTRSLRYIDDAGEMKVVFELKGNAVEKVDTQGGPYFYRNPVRRAVKKFSCTNDGQANQRYAFQIVFKPSDDASGVEVTMLEGHPQNVAMKD